MSTVTNSLNKVFFRQSATPEYSIASQDAGVVYYGTIIDGALLIDDSGDGTLLPGPLATLVPYMDGDRVAFVLRSRRPLILSVEGGFGASDEYAGLASIGEVNAEAASDAAVLAQQARDRAEAASDAFEEFVPEVEPGERILAGLLIAGPGDGFHVELDQTGVHFHSLVEGQSAPVEMLEINTPGTDGDAGNVFALRDPLDLGSLSMSINEAGQTSTSDLTVANVAQFEDVIVKGETLPEVVQSYMGRPIPVPLLSGSLVPNPAAPGVQRIGEFSWANPYDSEVQVSFAPTVLPGYLTGSGILMGMWTATTDGTLPPANTASARASGRVRDTAGDTQLVVPAWDITLPAGATLRAHMIMWVHQNATTWTLADGESWRPQVTVNPYPSAETDGVFASIVSASAPTAKKQYTKTWNTAWLRTFPTNSFYAGKATQGTWSGTTYRGFLGFPNMVADIGAAEIVKIEVYVYMSHWYYNAGGTLSIQGHGQFLEPTAQPSVSGSIVSLKTGKPGGGWVTLPSAYHAGFKAGTLRGIALVGSGLAAYGYATSGQIRVTYKK